MGFLSKELTVAGVEIEDTEGVYKAPQAATSYFQPLVDGFSITPTKDEKRRNILTSGFSEARARIGQKAVNVAVSVECRGSGVEGGESDFHPMMKAALGGERSLATRITTETGHTVSRVFIGDADISSLEVNDIILVLEGGAHHLSPIIAKDSTLGAAFVDLRVPAASAFSDNVEIAKFKLYYSSNVQADFPTLSVSAYWANEILEQAIGLRPASFALTNFSTSEIAQYDFSLEGISFGEIDGGAPHTPEHDEAVPPMILESCVFMDDEQITLNDFSFSVENTIGFITSTCSKDGRISSRFSGKRSVTGSMNPYKDDTSVEFFNKFNDNTAFGLFAYTGNPSTVDGEYELGSIQAWWMPECIITSKVVEDADGVLIESMNYRADGGESGSDNEFYLASI